MDTVNHLNPATMERLRVPESDSDRAVAADILE